MKRLADRFFRWFCHPDYYDEIQGDLEELYQRDSRQGRRLAQWNYFLRVIGLLRPSLIRSLSHYSLTNPAMVRHYFRISTRVLLRHKWYTAINLLGLVVGMGVCLLIYQYIYFELSYDRFHAHASSIYRLTQTMIRSGENQEARAYTTYGLGPAARESIPEIENTARVHPFDETHAGLIVINPEKNERHLENSLWYVDPGFLQLFDFPLKYGDRAAILDDPHTVVITEPMATRYFGNINPVGKTLRTSGGVMSGDFVVTGVLETLPTNSHLQFDFLLPISFLLDHYGPYKNHDDGWGWNYFVTYVQLDERASPENVHRKLDRLVAEQVDSHDESWQIGFQPLTDIHLHSNFPKDLATNHGDIQNVRFFALIALFILLIAWTNYINLSTARALHRAKEVGVRKSVGARQEQLVIQFLTESALMNVIAALGSVGLAYLILPLLNRIIGKELTFKIFQTLEFWGEFALVILVGTVLSGLYPAFVLSSFRPGRVLTSVRRSPVRGFSLRRGLIVFQFTISVLLIAGTYLVYQQIRYMKNQDLGFDTEEILVVDGPRVIIEGQQPEGLVSLFQTFSRKLTQNPAISSVCATSQVPGQGYLGDWNVLTMGAPESDLREGKILFTDTSFFRTYDLEFLAKRPFPADYSQYEWIVLNEAAVKDFGLGSAEEAVSQKLRVLGDTLGILGVVKDIHWSSLREAQVPILFTLDKYYGAYFSIKMNRAHIQESIARIEEAYHTVYPDDPFHYFFLDDDFNRQYQADLRFGNLFLVFSVLAIFIACIGLFALVSFSATLRIKEIGIRKVLGAGVGHLMMLLSCEYLFLWLIAVGAAVPLLWIGGNAWLANYAFRVGVGVDLFLSPGLIMLVICMITVGYRTYAAARANPVESLKTE